MLFTIITPTTGKPQLKHLIESINQQQIVDHLSIEHLIVVDGPQFLNDVNKIVASLPENFPRFQFNLPFNTGANRYFGHKIYASISQLARGDYVIFLDEDNYLETNHILSLYHLVTARNLQWCFCLRKIVDHDSRYLCNDDCESLGFLHHAFYDETIYMIDTNCMCVSKDVLIKTSPIWNRPGYDNDNDPDRVFSRLLMEKFKNYDCTYLYTVNYRISMNRDSSVNANLFFTGNQAILNDYGVIPWSKKNRVVVRHHDEQHTKNFIKKVYSQPSHPLSTYYLQNGYHRYLPNESKVLQT
jgi:glycosyltransferase involved in cell wall biosynthesis